MFFLPSQHAITVKNNKLSSYVRFYPFFNVSVIYFHTLIIHMAICFSHEAPQYYAYRFSLYTPYLVQYALHLSSPLPYASPKTKTVFSVYSSISPCIHTPSLYKSVFCLFFSSRLPCYSILPLLCQIMN